MALECELSLTLHNSNTVKMDRERGGLLDVVLNANRSDQANNKEDSWSLIQNEKVMRMAHGLFDYSMLECELSLTLNILSYCTDCVLIDVALLGSIRIESNESFHPSDQTSLGTRHRIDHESGSIMAHHFQFP
jgi:hypothetical protein